MSVPQHRDDRLWSIEDLSAFLGVPVPTLYRWRTTGYGPKGVRIGRYVRYQREGVYTWLQSLDGAA